MDYSDNPYEFLSDTTEQRAVERMFENAIQACSDLANRPNPMGGFHVLQGVEEVNLFRG